MLPLILNGEYFKIISPTLEDELDPSTKIEAQCQLCLSKTKISGSKQATGNFFKHLRRKHPLAMNKLEKAKRKSQENVSTKRKSDSVDEGESSNKQKQKTMPLTPFERINSTGLKCSKEIVYDLVFHYIEDEMLPIATVEKESFINLITGLSRGTKPPCRKTTWDKLHGRYVTMIQILNQALANTDYVCTTADIWSANNKSYMGVTCHYIDNELNRQSAVLACRRMKFSHTHMEIAIMLQKVHSQFNLAGQKLVGTVTDNATNFAKSFKLYALSENVKNDEVEFSNDDITVSTIINFDEMNLEENTDLDLSLPPHFRCCSHTLNLIATKDAQNALGENQYKKLYHSTFGKLTAIWNICHRSTSASDEIEKISNYKLIVPCPTRWNSLYDSVQRIILIKDHMATIAEKLNKPKLKTIEFEFLIEYSSVMAPLAKAIDILQGESNCYLGYVLPSLMQIKISLESLTHLSYCEPLRDALQSGLQKRYSTILDLRNSLAKPYILATVSLPKFKLKWLNGDDQEIVKLLFTAEMEKTYKNNDNSDESTISTDADDDFFSILNMNRTQSGLENYHRASITEPSTFSSVNKNKGSTCAMQLLHYLGDKSKELKSLQHYNIILDIFKKYNTVLPSSAPVERLFSAGGQILTPRRNRLSDKHFEIMLMLKKTNNTKKTNVIINIINYCRNALIC